MLPPPASWVPNLTVQAEANAYTKAHGLGPVDHTKAHTVDIARARAIAAAYDQLPVDDSSNPEVIAAYTALGDEVNAAV